MNVIRRAIFEKVRLKRSLLVGVPRTETNYLDYLLLTTVSSPLLEIASIAPFYVYTDRAPIPIHMHAWGIL